MHKREETKGTSSSSVDAFNASSRWSSLPAMWSSLFLLLFVVFGRIFLSMTMIICVWAHTLSQKMFLLLRKDDALFFFVFFSASLCRQVTSEPPAWENGFLRAVLLCELYSLSAKIHQKSTLSLTRAIIRVALSGETLARVVVPRSVSQKTLVWGREIVRRLIDAFFCLGFWFVWGLRFVFFPFSGKFLVKRHLYEEEEDV